MLTRIPWFLNRLRTMSAGEIGLRLGRAVAQQRERRRLGRGWSPARGRRLLGTQTLFGQAPDAAVIEAWRRNFTLDRTALDALLGGRAVFFDRCYNIGHPPRWHRDPDSGVEVPVSYGKSINYRDDTRVGNIKVLWELGRHQHLVPLAVAYAVSGERAYRDHVLAQVDSWIADNPYAMGIHWCSALEVALRAIAWSMVHSLLALRDGAGGLIAASADASALARSVYEHGYFIRHFLSRYSSANNHLLGELVGLWCLGAVFDYGGPSEDWSRLAREALAREARLQVAADGVAREQATHYQLEVLDYLLFAWAIGRSRGRELDDVVAQRIGAMLRFLRALAPAGGELPQLGDSDEGTVNRFRAGALGEAHAELLDTARDVFADPASTPLTEKGYWYRQIANARSSDPARPSSPDGRRARAREGVESFPEGGYAVLSGGAAHVVFDAGPLGYLSIAAHGHADALAFCAAWEGRWWLVDPGTYAYHSDPVFRAYFRGTAAHNTACVDNLDQSTPGGPFMWVRHARARLEGAGRDGDCLWAAGLHDGYRQLGLRHRRRIELRGGHTLAVVDRFERTAGRPLRVDLHFHFHPSITPRLGDGACTARREGTDATLAMTLDRAWDWRTLRGETSPVLGWYSPGLGRKIPSWTLQGTATLATACTTATTLRFSPGA